jgi:hypothetical protein
MTHQQQRQQLLQQTRVQKGAAGAVLVAERRLLYQVWRQQPWLHLLLQYLF